MFLFFIALKLIRPRYAFGLARGMYLEIKNEIIYVNE